MHAFIKVCNTKKVFIDFCIKLKITECFQKGNFIQSFYNNFYKITRKIIKINRNFLQCLINNILQLKSADVSSFNSFKCDETLTETKKILVTECRNSIKFNEIKQSFS